MFQISSRSGKSLDAIYSNGQWRLLASRQSSPLARKAIRPFAPANPVIPRTQWVTVSRPRVEVPILNQGQEASCVGHGASTGQMLARSISGQTFQLLSPTFIYSLINGGLDNGADPADAATALTTKGVCLMSEFGEGEYLASKIPTTAYATAERFKALEIYSCANFDEVVSAFLLGFSVFDTIMVGARFNNLDSDGVPPVAFGPGNHCTALGESLKQSRSGLWVVEHRNSWGTGWGFNGLFFQAEAHCTQQGGNYEAYAIKSVADDPQDVTDLPVSS